MSMEKYIFLAFARVIFFVPFHRLGSKLLSLTFPSKNAPGIEYFVYLFRLFYGLYYREGQGFWLIR